MRHTRQGVKVAPRGSQAAGTASAEAGRAEMQDRVVAFVEEVLALSDEAIVRDEPSRRIPSVLSGAEHELDYYGGGK